MTVTILGYRITIFRLERLERFTVQIDEATKQEAHEFKNSPRFAELKAQAAQIRASR